MTLLTTNTLLSNSTDDQRIMWMFLAQDYAKKVDGWNVNLIEKFPRVQTIREPVIAGVFGMTFLSSRSRMLLQDTAIPIGDTHHTPSGLARDYLMSVYNKKRRAFLDQKLKIKVERSAPLYCANGFYHDMVYADIRATYFTIMRNVGWDVDYCPDEFLLAGRAPLDFPLPEHKIARNCVYSASYVQDMEFWTGTAWQTKRNGSPLVNYCLIAYVLDLLHAIAITALGLGAVYIHTDGYVIPRANYDKLRVFCYELGLDLKIEGEGDAHIIAAGSYKVGKKKTKTYGRVAPSDVCSLKQVDIPFLVTETNHIVSRETARRIYKKGF
jgi:hypothetical protein